MHGRPHLSLLLAALACGVAGCSSGATGTVEPAPSASSAACTDALRQAPESVLGHPRTALDVAGAAAWGPPRIVLRCGLPEPQPTALECIDVDGVDWVLDERGDGLRFTTFGRAPAAEVLIPEAVPRTDATAALVDLAAVVTALPGTQRRCRG